MIFFERVALIWEPDRPQRSPYTGLGARTVGLVSDRTAYFPIPLSPSSNGIRAFSPGPLPFFMSALISSNN